MVAAGFKGPPARPLRSNQGLEACDEASSYRFKAIVAGQGAVAQVMHRRLTHVEGRFRGHAWVGADHASDAQCDRRIKPVHLRTARVLRLDAIETVRSIVLPAILPELVAGVRIAFSLSLLGVVIGEMFASKRGLGFAVMNAMGLGDIPSIMAIGIFLAAFAVVSNVALLAIEKKTGIELRCVKRMTRSRLRKFGRDETRRTLQLI
jgi:Binding-protein-dependent transport system inner membrane component